MDDDEWAIAELREFDRLTSEFDHQWSVSGDLASDERSRDIAGRRPVVERILDHHYQGWRTQVPDRGPVSWDWQPLQEMARRAVGLITRRREIEARLGPQGPALSSSSLHTKVWSAAASLWDDGYHQEAVEAAARAVQGHLKARLGRPDLDGPKLVEQAFGLDDPKSGQMRLRLCSRADPALFNDLHLGAMNLGKGCLALFRNLPAHGHIGASSAAEALEQLAAFSTFMRLVDRAEVVGHEPSKVQGMPAVQRG